MKRKKEKGKQRFAAKILHVRKNEESNTSFFETVTHRDIAKRFFAKEKDLQAGAILELQVGVRGVVLMTTPKFIHLLFRAGPIKRASKNYSLKAGRFFHFRNHGKKRIPKPDYQACIRELKKVFGEEIVRKKLPPPKEITVGEIILRGTERRTWLENSRLRHHWEVHMKLKAKLDYLQALSEKKAAQRAKQKQTSV